MTPHGVLDASKDAARIVEWWAKWPNANIGVACGEPSGIWAVDIDGTEGEVTLAELEAKHGVLPRTVEQVTGGGGRHLFFRLTTPVPNSVKRLGAGLDTRSTGGYVIGPPSVHPSGRRYAWSVDSAKEFATAPAWLVELLTAGTGNGAAKPAEEWRALVANGVTEGERNATIASLAGHLLRRYVDPHVALQLLAAWNRCNCRPPLDDGELARTVDSIARKELARRNADV